VERTRLLTPSTGRLNDAGTALMPWAGANAGQGLQGPAAGGRITSLAPCGGPQA
jgi:hypothetical protein